MDADLDQSGRRVPGFAGYAGELDNDPLNETDCAAASDADLSVRAAELQLFE